MNTTQWRGCQRRHAHAQIEVLEQRAAATGDLRRVARPQQWKSLKGPKTQTAAGDASGASEELFYIDASGTSFACPATPKMVFHLWQP